MSRVKLCESGGRTAAGSGAGNRGPPRRARSATLALVSPWSATTYELGDTGVWVIGDGRVGRLNGQIAQIDFASPAEAGVVDAIREDGREVFLRRGDAVTQVDPADPRAEVGAVDVVGADKLLAGGGTAAVMTKDGAVHVVASNT